MSWAGSFADLGVLGEGLLGGDFAPDVSLALPGRDVVAVLS